MKNNTMLSKKYLKTGGYSVLISCVAIAIVIVLNLFVNQLPASVTQIDMSSSNLLSITDKTVEFVKELKDDIKVYYIAQHGSEDSYITTMLDKYKDLSSKIKIEQIDPALNPGFFTGDRQNMAEGSLVVESAKRSKIITPVEIFYPGVSMDEIYSYYNQYGSMPQSTGFDLENYMTSALKYVTTDVLPIIYTLQGHGEFPLPEEYAGYLEQESMVAKELNLVSLEAVPEDCDCLYINAPENDISKEEADKILAYLKKGGKMVYVSYYSYTAEKKHTNLASVLEYYGLKAADGFVVEGDSNAHYPNYPHYIIPSYGEHEITTPLTGNYMLLGNNQGIVVSDDLRESVKVTPLLTTSDKAYSKLNYQTQKLEKEDGDIKGPFNIAVAVSETNEDNSETKIVWFNTPDAFFPSIYATAANEAIFKNTFGSLCEKQEAISVPVKNYEQNVLELNEAQGNVLTTIFTIILPLTVVVIGFVIWFRRRSR